jgi:hypothetical protein
LRDAANEIAKDRSQRTREIEGRSVDTTVEVQDSGGRKLPKNETLSVEEASHLVTGARNKQETVTDLNERDELARKIDAVRNGTTFEQLQAESQQQPDPAAELAQLSHDEQQQRLAAAQAQAQAATNDLARQLQGNPALLQAVSETVRQEQSRAEQAVQQAAAVIQYNAQVAAAALVSNFQELQGLQPHEIGTAIQVIGQRDPQRAQQIVNFIDRIAPLVSQAVQVREQQQQRQAAIYRQWQANQQAEFQRAGQLADAKYEQWVKAEGLSPHEHEPIKREAWAILLEGGTREQIEQAWESNFALRNATSQIALAEAARARIARRSAASKKDRSAPHVMRPVGNAEFVPDADHYLRKLERPGQELSAKEAAAFVSARRNARRR